MVSKRHRSRFIDRYLDGNLNEQELEQFKTELENNPEFKKELHLQESMNSALEESDVIDFRARLQTISKDDEAPGTWMPPRRVVSKRAIQVAASVAVLITFTFLAFWFGIERNGTEALFERYYEKYEPLNVRTGSPDIDQIFQKALNAYENKEFEMALMYFEEVLKMDRNRMEANLLTGASNMELEDFQEAENSFNRVIENDNNLFIEEAEWYLAFCYLKTNKTEKAKEQFEKFAQGNSEKQETARKILRRLR